MSSALFRAPLEPTVIRRASPSRPPLPPTFQSLDPFLVQPTDGDASMSLWTTNSSPESSKHSNATSNPAMSPTYSTGATSLDSKFFASSSGNNIPKDTVALAAEKRHQFFPHKGVSRRNTTRSSPDSNLTTIQETMIDQSSPSILTVERAAAAKIFLETYFNERMASGPSPRSIRLNLLQGDLYKRGAMNKFTPAELEAIYKNFCRRESEHLRESRVMKARSIRAMAAQRGAPDASLSKDYKVVKILGKGSFGVVRLVREKTCPKAGGCPSDGWSDAEKKQVYAMKVIRKSGMLRTSQEGHLRAERDFLVASEGSKWYGSVVGYPTLHANCGFLLGLCHLLPASKTSRICTWSWITCLEGTSLVF